MRSAAAVVSCKLRYTQFTTDPFPSLCDFVQQRVGGVVLFIMLHGHLFIRICFAFVYDTIGRGTNNTLTPLFFWSRARGVTACRIHILFFVTRCEMAENMKIYHTDRFFSIPVKTSVSISRPVLESRICLFFWTTSGLACDCLQQKSQEVSSGALEEHAKRFPQTK